MEYSSKKKIGKTILVIAAHPDDEVLGCGASIAKWAAAGDTVHIIIMAEGATSRRQERNSNASNEELVLLEKAAQRAGSILGVASVKLLNFPDNRMDSLDRLDIIKAIEFEIENLKPDTVLTHHCGDVNIDHCITHRAAVTACRPQPGNSVDTFLSFEIPSSTEWQLPSSSQIFAPNWYVDISKTLDCNLPVVRTLSVFKYNSEIKDPFQSFQISGPTPFISATVSTRSNRNLSGD